MYKYIHKCLHDSDSSLVGVGGGGGAEKDKCVSVLYSLSIICIYVGKLRIG